MANPSRPLTGWAFKQPGDSFLHRAGPPRLTGVGKKKKKENPGRGCCLRTEPSPRAEDWEIIVMEGKNIISIVGGPTDVFVMSEDEVWGRENAAGGGSQRRQRRPELCERCSADIGGGGFPEELSALIIITLARFTKGHSGN